MKGDRAEGGQIFQETIRQAGELVIVEMQLGGPGGEAGGQRGGSERPAAAVHLTAVTEAKVGTRR